MAIGHINFNRQTAHGAALRQALDQLEAGLTGLQAILATMVQMQNSGVSDSYIVGQYGFDSTATADSAVAELASDLGKLTTDASVSNVHAAITQLFSKFR